MGGPPNCNANVDLVSIHRAMLLILERCHEPLNMEELAKESGVGDSQFRLLVKAHAAVSPMHYHLRQRLDRARDLLRNTDKRLKEIGQLLGFHSAIHFSYRFRETQGPSPRAWRQAVKSRE